MNGAAPSDPRARGVGPTSVAAAIVAVLVVTSGCDADAPDQESASTTPAVERALEETALGVAEAFANRDRGDVERTEAWLRGLRGDYRPAEGVQVGRGQDPHDGLVLLTHAATSTYKCIAVTKEADVEGESVKIARISTDQPRC